MKKIGIIQGFISILCLSMISSFAENGMFRYIPGEVTSIQTGIQLERQYIKQMTVIPGIEIVGLTVTDNDILEGVTKSYLLCLGGIVMKRRMTLILICSLIFFGMIAHNASTILYEANNSKKYGYITGDKIYKLFTNNFSEYYKSVNDLILEGQKEFSSFILIMDSKDSEVGVYIHNDNWSIPLAEGRVFDDSELNSIESFSISNKKLNDSVGKPLYNDSNIYKNIYSIELVKDRQEFYPVTFYSNQPLMGFQEYALLDFEPNSYNQMYSVLHLILSAILVVLTYQYYFKKYQNLITVKKLCGISTFKIWNEFISELIVVFFISFGLSSIVFCLVNPKLLAIGYFQSKIVANMLNTCLFVCLFIIFVSMLLYLKIRYTTTMDVLRSDE